MRQPSHLRSEWLLGEDEPFSQGCSHWEAVHAPGTSTIPMHMQTPLIKLCRSLGGTSNSESGKESTRKKGCRAPGAGLREGDEGELDQTHCQELKK